MTERKFKLTNARVRDLPIASETRIYWDADLPGFGVRVMKGSGTRTYLLQRRTKKGSSIKIKLGRAGEVSADWARQRALELVRDIAAGGDPAADLKAARQAERERQRAPTVERLITDWIAAKASGWRPSTVDNYRLWTGRHVLPALGRRKAPELEPGDVRRWYRDLAATGRGHTANRSLAVLSSAYSWAVASDDWPTIASNPCHGAIARDAKAREHHRERYPANGELERLVVVLRDRGDLASKFYLVLLLTGARRGELIGARWGHFDLDAMVWTKPRALTKQKREHRLPLNVEAAAILRELKGAQPFSPFGQLGDGALRKTWVVILRDARITDLRVHDLRHWHASLLASMGLSLPMIGSLLGHSSPGTTARYTALVDDALRKATGGLGELVGLAGEAAMIERDWLIIEAPPTEVERLRAALARCNQERQALFVEVFRLTAALVYRANPPKLDRKGSKRTEQRRAANPPDALDWFMRRLVRKGQKIKPRLLRELCQTKK